MPDWKLHIPTPENAILVYKCGLKVGQFVVLKKDLVIHSSGKPTGEFRRKGERWQVLPGITTDPVLWLFQPDGERHTWPDDPAEVSEWFENHSS